MFRNLVILQRFLPKVFIFFVLFDSVYNYYFDGFESSDKLPVRLGNDCDRRVIDDHEFYSCKRRATESWQTYDRDSRNKYECCLIWDVLDCQQKSIHTLCNIDQYEDSYKSYNQRKDEYIYQYETYKCNYYKYTGTGCRFPVWAIVLCVLAGVFVILAMAGICVYIRRRSRRLKEEREEGFK